MKPRPLDIIGVLLIWSLALALLTGCMAETHVKRDRLLDAVAPVIGFVYETPSGDIYGQVHDGLGGGTQYGFATKKEAIGWVMREFYDRCAVRPANRRNYGLAPEQEADASFATGDGS